MYVLLSDVVCLFCLGPKPLEHRPKHICILFAVWHFSGLSNMFRPVFFNMILGINKSYIQELDHDTPNATLIDADSFGHKQKLHTRFWTTNILIATLIDAVIVILSKTEPYCRFTFAANYVLESRSSLVDIA